MYIELKTFTVERNWSAVKAFKDHDKALSEQRWTEIIAGMWNLNSGANDERGDDGNISNISIFRDNFNILASPVKGSDV